MLNLCFEFEGSTFTYNTETIDKWINQKISNLCYPREDGCKIDPDFFKNLCENSTVLSEISFPRMTPWSNDEYLETLARSRIRRVFPWSYLGGTAYGQCYDSVLKGLCWKDRIKNS